MLRREQKNMDEAKPLMMLLQSQEPKTQYNAATGKLGSSRRTTLRSAVRQTLRDQKRKQIMGEMKSGTFSSLFNSSKTPKPRLSMKQVDGDGYTHSRLYKILNPKSHEPAAILFQRFMTAVILTDVIFYIVSTEETLEDMPIFYHAECISSVIFLVEYVCRLCICTEQRKYGKHGPIFGRLKYLSTAGALLDTFATLPFFLEFISGVQLPTLTYLRIFRLLRITRTNSYSKAMEAVIRVFYFNKEIMVVAGLLAVYLVLLTSILMYYLRPRGDAVNMVDDMGDFNSIGSTMVLSLMMLTGQGGPSGDLPWYTQAVVLMTSLFSVAMFAIPASMLTWGFEAEAQRLGEKAKKKIMAQKRGEVYHDSTSSSSSDDESAGGYGDISTSDEEYMNIIGGEESDEESVGAINNTILTSLEERMSKLEDTVAETNMKLDLILQKL